MKSNSMLNNDENSMISEEVSPSHQKNHVQLLVTMLNEKNQYIKVLHNKIDKLNDIVHQISANPDPDSVIKSKSKLQNEGSIGKSRSQQNIHRAKSASNIGSKYKAKNTPDKNEEKVQKSMNVNFDKVMENLNAMKQNNLSLMKELIFNETSSLGEVSLENNDYYDAAIHNDAEIAKDRSALEDCNYQSIGG